MKMKEKKRKKRKKKRKSKEKRKEKQRKKKSKECESMNCQLAGPKQLEPFTMAGHDGHYQRNYDMYF